MFRDDASSQFADMVADARVAIPAMLVVRKLGFEKFENGRRPLLHCECGATGREDMGTIPENSVYEVGETVLGFPYKEGTAIFASFGSPVLQVIEAVDDFSPLESSIVGVSLPCLFDQRDVRFEFAVEIVEAGIELFLTLGQRLF